MNLPTELNMRRGKLVKVVGDGHAGALNIALQLTTENLQRCVDRDLIGARLWWRVKDTGKLPHDIGRP